MASDELEKFAWLNEPEAMVAGPDKAAQPPPESKGSGEAPPASYHLLADLILRVLLFVSTLTAVLVMVTSKQTEYVSVPVVIPGVPVFITPFRTPAKFNYSPAFIYFVAALSVAGLYSIITSLLSFLAILKPGSATKLVFHFLILDVLMLGIVTAATGAAGAVGYIGLKGNSHSGWQKVCNTFDKYCRHIGVSLGVSLFASILLALLVLLSVHNLSRKVPK